MLFDTAEQLTREQTNKGLTQVLRDGLATETMSCLTEGAFLVALALQLGASNFQIGLIAALPTFTNVFQLAAIKLVMHYKSRRAVTVISLLLARLPLILVAFMPFLFAKEAALNAVTILMFIHYFFGSVAGASWNSWMKDLVPQNKLGSYFSKRVRYTQTLNVVLSLSLAFVMDYLKSNFSSAMPVVIPVLFVLGGLAGMISVFALAKAPEPKANTVKENLWPMFLATFKDGNFRRLLMFHSCWIFAFNLAAPFFSVFMMKTMGMPVSYILFLNVLSQVCSILCVRFWGRYADAYSNKNIIRICGPLYITALFAWVYTASAHGAAAIASLLIGIHIITGVASAGINLSLSNIGLKLAPQKDAMMYLAAKNTITALFSAASPLAGGLLADFFGTHQLSWNIQWAGDGATTTINLLNLHQWNFFFILAALLCRASMLLLKLVKEDGEISRPEVMSNMRYKMKHVRYKAVHASAAHIRAVPVQIRRITHSRLFRKTA